MTISAVPTNIITGFLGSGKTTTILNLLQHKPEAERWAILVNEFGEIGVDGSLYAGHQQGDDQRVFIREVPGGCMCCAAGVPMRVALNQLLATARPDRLLIEPTGLGHPKEVLQVLSAPEYQHSLALQKILTLVDARKLSDTRYTNHATFNQQIALADIVVGNKLDLYGDGDREKLEAYVGDRGLAGARIMFTSNGNVAADSLVGRTSALTGSHGHDAHHGHHESSEQSPLLADIAIPECGYVSATNQGEGFCSNGFRFAPRMIFDYGKLNAFIVQIEAERMKAVFNTDAGVYSYNLTEDGITEEKLAHCTESRIEVVARHPVQLESQLLACVLN